MTTFRLVLVGFIQQLAKRENFIMSARSSVCLSFFHETTDGFSWNVTVRIFVKTCRRISILVTSKNTSSHEELQTFMIYLLLEHVKSFPRHRDSKSVVKARRKSACRVKRGKSHIKARILVLSFQLHEPMISQLDKKFPAFYGIQRFSHNGKTIFVIQRQLNPVHAVSCYVLKIHCKVILPSNNRPF